MTIPNLKNWFKTIIILIFVELLPSALLACPNCKAGFTETTQQASVGEAMSLSVIFMIALPVFLISTIAMMIRRQSKKALAERQLTLQTHQ